MFSLGKEGERDTRMEGGKEGRNMVCIHVCVCVLRVGGWESRRGGGEKPIEKERGRRGMLGGGRKGRRETNRGKGIEGKRDGGKQMGRREWKRE